ncbi:hypothetical protein D7V86_25695 [bacterium D16-51]|nr:hypothetical protein D7V96_25535 [bacterium D16-59]RKI52789.1 hypothetical protein D7V86_25695 [bacterium D16-51]
MGKISVFQFGNVIITITQKCEITVFCESITTEYVNLSGCPFLDASFGVRIKTNAVCYYPVKGKILL